MKRQAQWVSIFGEVEAVVAEAMVQEGKASYLPGKVEDFPSSARFNALGEQAKFAIVIPNCNWDEFEERITALRN